MRPLSSRFKKTTKHALVAFTMLFSQVVVPITALTQPAFASEPENAELSEVQSTVDTAEAVVKYDICHAPAAQTNPYVTLSVPASAIDGIAGNSPPGQPDHYGQHTGPIWTPGATSWGDIIPPLDGIHDGLNWPEGEAIWENNCNIPEEPHTVDVTIFKSIDDDGDGFTDRPADANEWSFALNSDDELDAVPLTNPTQGLVFEDLSIGEYTIQEFGPDGYFHFGEGADCLGQVEDGVWTFSVEIDTENLTCNFWNQAYDQEVEGEIVGRKYNDADRNGLFDKDTEERLEGWDIRLYDSAWTLLETETTDDVGKYVFDDLAAGKYYTCEVLKDGWLQTGPLLGADSVDNDGNLAGNGVAVANASPNVSEEGPICWSSSIIEDGQENNNHKFGNDKTRESIRVSKFNDRNQDGERQRNEGRLGDWTIRLYDAEWQYVDEVTTLSDDWAVFYDLEPGIYLLCEAQQNKWVQSMPVDPVGVDSQSGAEDETGNCYRVRVRTGGDVVSRIFGNYQLRPSVRVIVHKGTMPEISDQEFKFKVKQDGEVVDRFSLDTDPRTKIDNKSEVVNVYPGQVKIVENEVEGWISASRIVCYDGRSMLPVDGARSQAGPERPTPRPIASAYDTNKIKFEVEAKQTVHCFFLNIEFGDVMVTKFHDLNENGKWDKDEPTLEGWEMNLEAFEREMCGRDSLTTDSIDLAGDNCDYTLNGDDHEMLPVETWLQTTEEDGSTTFMDLNPSRDRYYLLSENSQEGWHQTSIYCRRGGIMLETDAYLVDDQLPMKRGGEKVMVRVAPGRTTNCFVGNTYNPDLLLTKTNDAADPVEAGADEQVTYTLTVTVPEDSGCVYRQSMMYVPNHFGGEHMMLRGCEAIEDDVPEDLYKPDVIEQLPDMEEEVLGEVTVTDLAPEGFVYVPGSWTAMSSVRGDLKAAGITGEPGYASPGQWTLTSQGSPFLVPGEVVTLTYLATVTDDVTPGTYPDVAYVEGYTQMGEKFYGNVATTGDPFVGTEVVVIETVDEEGGFVLGELVNTGVPAILAPIVGLTVAGGALLLSANREQRRSGSLASRLSGLKNLLILPAALVMLLGFSGNAVAAAFWSVDISAPPATSQTGEFEVSYVVSTTENGDDFSVSLLQDGVEVDSAAIAAGLGDSGTFEVDLATEGTYDYAVKVTNNGDATVKTSDTVTVVYDETDPSTPAYDGVVRSGDSYTITITAPSGDVSEIKVFASTEMSFELNEATLIETVAVSPGETITVTYDAPDSTQRYFAAVAMDDAGNQSAVVGDDIVATGTGSALIGDGDDAAVLQETSEDDAPDAIGNIDGETTDGDDGDDEEDDGNNGLLLVILAVAIVGGGYYYFGREPEQS